MKVILTLLLQRYELELVDPNPVSVSGPAINRPRKPCLVRYRRRRSFKIAHPERLAAVSGMR
jgi:sterol 14-demethylase